MICCIKNISCDVGIEEEDQRKLIHTFSKLAAFEYDYNKVEEWIDKNYYKLNENEGYKWNDLIHECIKEGNPEFYESKIILSYPKQKKNLKRLISNVKSQLDLLKLIIMLMNSIQKY